MKKLCMSVVLAMFSVSALQIAHAATSKTTTHHPLNPYHHYKKKKVYRKAKKVAATPAVQPIPEGAEIWRCSDHQTMYIAGNMKRDAVLTMHWDGKNYKLPRQQTTTGADRFHDVASGMDLVVIPDKGMLFSDKSGERIADDCKTTAMAHENVVAPTQSSILLKAGK